MNLPALLDGLRQPILQLILTVFGGWLIHRLTTKTADLISYMSHVQTVTLPAHGATPALTVNTFILFLWNQGKAAARDVQVLHHFLPAHNVFPDVQRNTIATPAGGTILNFPSIPPKLCFGVSVRLIDNIPLRIARSGSQRSSHVALAGQFVEPRE
jgi:hypothetical protein